MSIDIDSFDYWVFEALDVAEVVRYAMAAVITVFASARSPWPSSCC